MINLIFYEGGQKFARPVKNRDEYISLRNAPENAKNFYDARGGDEKSKANQVQFCYNDLLPNGVLKGCCHPSSTYAHDIDCGDQKEQERIRKILMKMKDKIGLLELSGSARYGLHAVCRRDPGKTIRECQYALSMLTKTEYDTNSRGLARVLYTGPATEDNLFYLDDAIFEEPLTVEESAKEYALLKKREKENLEEVPAEAKKAIKHYRPWEDAGQPEATKANRNSSSESSEPHAVPSVIEATERTRFVFNECMKEEDVRPEDLLNEGGRHNSVKVVLSHCNQLLSEGETLGVLKELMPEHWSDPNIRDLVTAYYTDYYNPQQRLSLFQKRVFRDSKRLGIESKDSPMGGNALSRLFASPIPPEIPAVLPKLVKAATSCTPRLFKGTVAQAIFPPLATYPKKLSFVYIDNQVRDLRINCLIVAGTGSGKDSCTKQPLIHLIAEMKARDEENRKRLRKFNEEYNSKASNKQKPQRPEGLIIQTIKSDITKAALAQRMDEADEAPLYVRLNELEQWDQIEGKSGRSNQFTTLKLCDDEVNDYGADRAGTQSVSASGCLHLNWNANTTTSKAIRYFRHVLTDGPISRLCLATVPPDEEEYGADIAVFGNYGQEYDDALKPYIDNLKNATGVIDCPQAKRLARKLKNECAEFARLSQDKVFDNLSHRALVHAFRKACLLYAANGMKWEKAIEGFCRWSLFYDLYLKMTIWGDLIRHADDDIPTSKRGPQSLLDFLPETFTVEDAKRVRLQQGLDAERAANMVATWKTRGHVCQISDFSFQKVHQKTNEQ